MTEKADAFRAIGAPLMAAVSDWHFLGQDKNPDFSEIVKEFSQLAESLGQLVQKALEDTGLQTASAQQRWNMAVALTDINAAFYRASGKALSSGQVQQIIGVVQKNLSVLQADGVSAGEMTASSLIYAISPVVAAVERYSFGVEKAQLLENILGRMEKICTDVMNEALRVVPAQNLPLFYQVYRTAAELYADSHYTEMDRLISLSAEERILYVKENNAQIPLLPVWYSFDRKMNMLKVTVANIQRKSGQ